MTSYAFRIGTRGSPLALAQTHLTRRLLAQAHGLSEDQIEVLIIKTTGDMIQDRALSESGGKGLFTKELDQAMLDGRIDIAVHSSKDLPTVLPDGLSVAGYLPREDVRDAFICNIAKTVADLPKGAHIGTASLRRGAQLKRLRPDLQISLLRGNVQTRLRRIEDGDFDATILALAGLTRLGLAHCATSILDIDDFLPAVGQGAIGITANSDDERSLNALNAILHPDTGYALDAERAFLHALDGSCRMPIGGYARVEGSQIHFKGAVYTVDGSEALQVEQCASISDARRIGAEAGQSLKSRMRADFLCPA
jgi:hydroxymethylbilane synthase